MFKRDLTHKIVYFSTGLLSGKSPASSLTSPQSSLLTTGSLSLSCNLKLSSNLTPSFSSSSSPHLLSSSLLTSSKLTSNVESSTSKAAFAPSGSKTSKIEAGFGNLSLQGAKKVSGAVEEKKASSRDKSMKQTHPVSGAQGRKRTVAKIEKAEKRKKVETKAGVITSQVIKKHTIDRPEYAIKCQDVDLMEEYMEVDLPKFVPPSADMRLVQSIGKSLTDVIGLKVY